MFETISFLSDICVIGWTGLGVYIIIRDGIRVL